MSRMKAYLEDALTNAQVPVLVTGWDVGLITQALHVYAEHEVAHGRCPEAAYLLAERIDGEHLSAIYNMEVK